MLQSQNHGTPPLPSSSASSSSSSSSSSSTSTSTSTSTSLLSLLPPLPRAQAALSQMASLTTQLFLLSPNRSLWSSSYRSQLPIFLPSNSNPSNPNPNPNPNPTPNINITKKKKEELISHLSSLQSLLFDSIAQLQDILDLQDLSRTLSRHLLSSHSSLRSFSQTLHLSQDLLENLLTDYADHRARKDLDLNDVLAFAHKISYTTFAPPDHGAGAPLRGALPPAPQDNEMRASQLYQFADMDVGVERKKRKAEGAPAAAGASDRTAPDVVLMEEEEKEKVPPAAAHLLPITVPPGWRKGMPVELPPVPSGWKPGDPVPLPPLEEKAAVPMPVPVPAAMQKVQEAIQVKYVELDINPDQDEYSSDYSSEVGSSEEDDDD